MRDATRVVRAGLPPAAQGEPFLPGPTFAGVYHAAGDPAQSPYTYGRYHNPTWTRFEEALGELEGGSAVIFASGMAATAALFGATLRAGETIVLPADGYYTTRLIAEGYFTAMGVRVRLAPTAGNGQAEALEGARLLWLESPSNPSLDVCDIAALAGAAHERGMLVVVDNTTPTALGQQPLALGADFVVASDTKALTGHADLVLGHVAAREAAWAERLRTWRTQMGAVPGPMEVWRRIGRWRRWSYGWSGKGRRHSGSRHTSRRALTCRSSGILACPLIHPMWSRAGRCGASVLLLASRWPHVRWRSVFSPVAR